MRKLIPVLTTTALLILPSYGQTRRATIVGGGNVDQGKCTVEVVVDGAADVQISGDTARLRDVSGRPPQWRRFECTAPVPANPVDFRFQGVDGRGRQTLLRDPREGGPIVIRLEDPDSGAEAYTFDILWSGGARGGYNRGDNNGGRAYGSARRYDYADNDSGEFSTDQAIRSCRDEVRRRAQSMFGTGDLDFDDMRVDDNPSRRDAITGSFFLRRDRDRDTPHQFVCNVNLARGRVRSVEIDPTYGQDYYGSADRMTGTRTAVQTCQNEVNRRMNAQGYGSVSFDRINVGDGPARSDVVVGSINAQGRYGVDRFDFTCRVDLNDGDVRSVDLRPR